MSSWPDLGDAIKTTAEADTGSGGLFPATGSESAKILAFWGDEVLDAQALPYVRAQLIPGVAIPLFDANEEVHDIGVQFDVVTAVDWGKARHTAIVERVKDLFRRQTISVSGWNVSDFLPTGEPRQYERDGNVHISTLDFDIVMSRTRS